MPTNMQPDLFNKITNHLSTCQLHSENAPQLSVEGMLNATITQAINNSGLSRDHIVDRINLCLRDDTEGVVITKAQLNKWLAPSQTMNHVPAWVMPAICWATRSIEPLLTLSKALHFDLVDNREQKALAYGQNLINQERMKKQQKLLVQDLLQGNF